MTKPRSYEPLTWHDGTLRYLDQVLLPHQTSYAETNRCEDVVDAIRRLAIRGAPLLGVAGAYAVVLASMQYEEDPSSFRAALEKIANARPTAVNLRSAVTRLESSIAKLEPDDPRRSTVLLEEAIRLHDEVRSADLEISRLGAELFSDAASILTICNTGPLATGGSGTAFGVIAAAWDQKKVRTVYACETRPLLQGARLTMWELAQIGIPATLVHDSAAGSLFAEGRVDAVICGADRIAANGDTANKIGTYMLACLAKHHGIPLYVAAPTSTIDPETALGKDIPIEHRDGREITSIGPLMMAPAGSDTYAPAFDVTPADLIAAFVTENGIFRRPYAFRDLPRPMAKSGTS